MSKTRRFTQFIFSTLIILSLSLSVSQPQSASAQGGDGIKRQVNAETGKVSFIGPQSGRSVSAAKALGTFIRPQDPAMALAKRFAPEFGLKNPERDLTEMKANHPDDGRMSVRYQQNHEGVPVMGGELIVNTNENGDLYSMNGEVSPNLSLQTQPTIDSAQAKESALQAAAKWYQKTPADFVVTEPELWIFDESLLITSTRPAELVWRMEVTSMDNSLPLRELVLINAQRGNISLHFNQVDTAWHSHSNNPSREQGQNSNDLEEDVIVSEKTLLTFSPLVNTYTSNNTTSLPGTFLCNQSQPNCTGGTNPHADTAHKYAIGTFNLYDIQHNRNSINNSGMTIISTVHYDSSYANAFWSGAQMVYGDGYGFPLADDVVAHEFTHGVTEYESNLFYYYQSGAINESFSDVWGEYYDQTNGQGNDTVGVKWQIGEDVSGRGASRSMSNPPAFGDPDKITHANYNYDLDFLDSGGVHTNSGVNNKAAFLMVDGGTFNGKTVTALGWVKTAAIYYETNRNLLSSGADYSDLYYAIQQACSNLIGRKGITAGNCVEVKDAVDAVEMNMPVIWANGGPLCDPNGHILPYIDFADDLEAGTSKWTFTKTGTATRWQIDAPSGAYAQSGLHSLFADDYPDDVAEASARLAAFVVPSNAYMRFEHAYDFETWGYDGGVLEYSTNGGAAWVDAGSLMDLNGYNDSIDPIHGNPLAGRLAFANSSRGYVSTGLNLSSLAGQTVTFRWRMGLDNSGFSWGWWVDNIKVYRCGVPNSYVFIGGAFKGRYYVPSGKQISNRYGVNGGPVHVVTNDGVTPIFASQRAIFGSSFNSIVGYPADQLTTDYWFTSYDDTGMITYLVVGNPSENTGNPSADTALVDVYIGGNKMNATPYAIAPGQRIFPRYGINAGPVHVVSTNGVDIFTSERTKFGNSFNEVMGYPGNQLTTDYWFTSYDDLGMITYLVIGNPHPSNTAEVDVYIGGIKKNATPYNIAPGQRIFPRFAINAGPVRVVSTNGVDIFTSERSKFGNTFNEVMGYPANQLTTDYWFTSYDDVGMITYLVIGNPHPTLTAEVDVYIDGVKKNLTPYVIAPGQRVFPRYGINQGPVHVVSTNGVDIFTSERAKYLSSFNEILGLADNQLTTDYWFTSYDDVGMSTFLVIAAP